jgi:uncharacterized protein DUF6544
MSSIDMQTVRTAEAELARLCPDGSFEESELEGLPEAVRRYFRRSIELSTPLARSTRLWMRGSVKQGRWWLPFRARQILAPLQGFVWAARVGGILVGSDRLVGGEALAEWKLFGTIGVARTEGPDVARSSAGRAGAESVWVPTAMLPRFGVTWSADDANHLTAGYRLHDVDIELQLTLDDEARVRSIALDRWGGPERAGFVRFVHALSRYSIFDGVSVPSAGRGGWFAGTGRWSEAEFFRYEITRYEPVV